MKITFVANFMNHHQLPFCRKMCELTGGKFTFIALEAIPSEQSRLGYHDMNDYDFVLKAYENNHLYQEAMQKILEDDIVIFGSCPNDFINMRMHLNKLSILYTERFFKKGLYRRFIPITYYKIYDRILKHKGKNIKIICSSAYAPLDFKLLRCNIPIYKWGYFPEFKKYEIDKLMTNKEKNIIQILWVGRLIKFKHAEHAIDVVQRLYHNGYNINLNIIGTGRLENQLKEKVKKANMDKIITFLGPMSPEKVRDYMEQSDIFLFTSDFNEGWGAVLNEAMNSGCAIVASHATGSVPFLIEDGVNGFIYRSGDKEQLYIKTKQLVENRQLIKRLGKEAYLTLYSKWNPDEATRRLYKMLSYWLSETTELPCYDDGPLSKAKILKQDWYEE